MTEELNDLERENAQLKVALANAEARLSELQGLEARIRELEAREDRRQGTDREESRKRLHEVADRSTDEIERIIRGIAHAAAESMRSNADSLAAALEELTVRRRRRDQKESAEEPPSRGGERGSGDLLAAVATGLERSLDGPDRVIQHFFDGYHSWTPRRPRAEAPD